MQVSEVARRFGVSRGTLLYYESVGLMKPAARTAGNYRRYSQADLTRLEMIRIYRNAGLKLEDIRAILDQRGTDLVSVLNRRLQELDGEIAKLRGHQGAILKLLQRKRLPRRNEMVTKEKWVSIMKASGFSEEDMHRWHSEFERLAPEEHQEFLGFLHIPAEEVRTIRQWSA